METLSLPNSFNSKNNAIKKLVVDANYKKLSFSFYHTKRIYDIPNCFKVIEFSKYFNQPLISKNKKFKLIPNGVEKIKFFSNFDQSIDYLPDSIKCLVIRNNRYSHSISNLPPYLESFEFHANKSLENLPITITDLVITLYPEQGISWLKRLRITNLEIHFVDNFKIERITNVTNLMMLFEKECLNFDFSCLPNNVKKLTFGYGFKSELGVIPDSVEKLTIEDNLFDQSLISLKNSKLKKLLLFSSKFNNEISGVLPDSLEFLQITDSDVFDKSLDNLPPNLKILNLSWLTNFNQSFDNLPFLTELYLDIYIPEIKLDFLPCSLQKLQIKTHYSLVLNNLPNLKKLAIDFSDEYIPQKNTIKIKIPQSVDTLILGNYNYDIAIKTEQLNLPENLRVLGLGYSVSINTISISDYRFNYHIFSVPQKLAYILLSDVYLYMDDLASFPSTILTNFNEILENDFWNY